MSIIFVFWSNQFYLAEAVDSTDHEKSRLFKTFKIAATTIVNDPIIDRETADENSLWVQFYYYEILSNWIFELF